MYKTIAGCVAMAVVLGGSAVALAQNVEPSAPAELTIHQLIAKLEATGYTAIDDVEKDDGHWEAEATNAAGQRVEVEVDVRTGAILREEPDNDRD